MSTFVMKDIPIVSKYVLTQSNNLYIQEMNKGFIDNKEVGIFEIVAYHAREDKVLIRKPIEDSKSFIVPMRDYEKHFKDFMPIILHNN